MKTRVKGVVAQRTSRGRALFQHVQPMLAGIDAITGLENDLADRGREATGGPLTQDIRAVGGEAEQGGGRLGSQLGSVARGWGV